MYAEQRTQPKETEPNTMFNKITLIGRLGQNAEAKTAQNNREFVVLNIATPGELEERQGRVRDPHRMAPRLCLEGGIISKFAKLSRKGSS